MDVNRQCGASAFCPGLKYHEVFSCTFSVAFLLLQKKETAQPPDGVDASSLRYPAYLKIVIRDEENSSLQTGVARWEWTVASSYAPPPTMRRPHAMTCSLHNHLGFHSDCFV